MTDRQRYETIGLLSLFHEERYGYLMMFGNPTDGSQRLVNHWVDTFQKLQLPIPANLVEVRSSHFEHEGYLVLSMKFPNLENWGECYSGCLIIGPVENWQNLSDEQARKRVDSADWYYFLLQSGEPNCKMLVGTSLDEDMIEAGESEYFDEQGFTKLMLESLMES